MCACSSVCEYMLCVGMCTHLSGGQRTVLGVGPQELSTFFVFVFLVSTVSHDLELIDEPGLSGQVVSSRCLPVSSQPLPHGNLASIANTVAHRDLIVECHRYPSESSK